MAADRQDLTLRIMTVSPLQRGRYRRSKWMKPERPGNDTVAATAHRQPRCICCGGVIETSPDQDASLGLNVALGLVSDECALICNDCTSQLIATRKANKLLTRGRR
jgi:hypothetical protein